MAGTDGHYNNNKGATMNTPPKWFYFVVTVALIWNIIGLIAVGFNLLITEEQLALLPTEQQQLMQNTPVWSVIASAVAVITGTLGCVLLLLKKQLSQLLFIISILALVIQDIALFVVLNTTALLGITPLIMQTIVFIIALGLYLLSRKAKSNNWIN